MATTLGLGDLGSPLLIAVILGHVVAILLTVLLAVYVARTHWETRIGRVFTFMVGSFTVWILGSLVRLATIDPGTYIAFTTVKYVGITTAPVWFLFFALLYAGKGQWVTRRVTGALLVVPALTLLVLATTQSHGLFYRSFSVTTLGEIPILSTTVGPWFWLFSTFAWGLLAIGSVLFVSAGVRRSGLYRGQSAIVILAILISVATNFAYVFRDWPHAALDPTPFGFAVTSLLLAVGIFSTRLIDVVPAARSLVLDAIDDGVIVLDPKHQVVDVNEAARSILECDRPIGKPAGDVVPASVLGGRSAEPAFVELPVGDETRQYRHRMLPIGPDGTHGEVIVLTDVSSQVRMQRNLERQNERLEEFASVVSHDLRNPLNVAIGRLELVEEESDSEHVGAIDRSLHRMEELIEDLLGLARTNDGAISTGEIDLAATVEASWDLVPTEAATLAVTTGRTIRADGGLLQQLLENLLQNAVDHGGPEVTVTVGDLDGGFYVEDDGQGVSAFDREAVFTRGYTTSDGGTGFGLTIVDQVAAAHGWELRLTEGASGGARFEVAGVDSVST